MSPIEWLVDFCKGASASELSMLAVAVGGSLVLYFTGG